MKLEVRANQSPSARGVGEHAFQCTPDGVGASRARPPHRVPPYPGGGQAGDPFKVTICDLGGGGILFDLPLLLPVLAIASQVATVADHRAEIEWYRSPRMR